MPLFYLSFADPKLPKGEQFLGATIVDAPSAFLAAPRAWELGVNPGGEVKFSELDVNGPDDLPESAKKYYRAFVPRDVVMAEASLWKDN